MVEAGRAGTGASLVWHKTINHVNFVCRLHVARHTDRVGADLVLRSCGKRGLWCAHLHP